MKTRVICVRTGNKYDQWYEDNLKHMVDTYSGIDYDEFCVIREDEFDGVFNKLQMFDKFRDGQNIYFDLDVIIKGDCNQFLRKDLHVCHAWWRLPYHTPLNSSIISWQGDQSHIWDFFEENPDKYMLIYDKGIDQLLYENVPIKTYSEGEGFCSFQSVIDERAEYSVYLFNQRYEYLRYPGWWSRFQIAQ